ncbi:hypothetical protein K502DRAFT_253241 [Neoconidiobolus thromboides FSU 785]|nr:hypothetical protein K502DRAFT_253241 [Neoconidiobolus thromboides FSU 785]
MYNQNSEDKKEIGEGNQQSGRSNGSNINLNDVSTTNDNTRVKNEESEFMIASSNVVDLTNSPNYQNELSIPTTSSAQLVDLTQNNSLAQSITVSAQLLDLNRLLTTSKQLIEQIQNKNLNKPVSYLGNEQLNLNNGNNYPEYAQSSSASNQYLKQSTSKQSEVINTFSEHSNPEIKIDDLYGVLNDLKKSIKELHDNSIVSENFRTHKKRNASWENFNHNEKRAQNSSSNSGNDFNLNSRGNENNDNDINEDVIIDKSKLTKSQVKVVDAIFKDGKNVFFTGSAGTGKSLLLRYIIEEIRNRENPISYNPNIRFRIDQNINFGLPNTLAVTASTGIAAFNIGGCTVHSFAGIGLGTGTVKELVKKIITNKKSIKRWLRLKYLIIDEISMLNGELFDKLEQIACKIREEIVEVRGKPFGGIQVI